ncbi:dihydroorotate dehydrogenase [Sulfolobales archaeon HS-7]|nr:dihydroorotate dehydrogenase [Sulfolobales archaeon HS-7]
MNVFNRVLNNPIVVASGILPPVTKLMRDVCRKYAPGGITTKSMTIEPLQPHQPPTLLQYDHDTYINAIGLGNPGIKTLNKIGCFTIVSIAGNSVDNITLTAREAERIGDAIEINVSSPNRAGYGESLSSHVSKIVKEIKGLVTVPVLVKLGPWENIVDISGKALSAGADGLTLTNTIKGMIIDVHSMKPILSYKTGGISGRALHPIAVRAVYEVYKEYQPVIIGTGGVISWEDAVEFMLAGATLVGIGSGIISKGFDVIRKVNQGIEEYLESKGLKLKDLIGYIVR